MVGPWDSEYDQTKDQLVKTIGSVSVEHYKGEVRVELRSYDGGPPTVHQIGVNCFDAPNAPPLSPTEAARLGKLLIEANQEE